MYLLGKTLLLKVFIFIQFCLFFLDVPWCGQEYGCCVLLLHASVYAFLNPTLKLKYDSSEEKLNNSLLFTDIVEEYGALDPLLRYY